MPLTSSQTTVVATDSQCFQYGLCVLRTWLWFEVLEWSFGVQRVSRLPVSAAIVCPGGVKP